MVVGMPPTGEPLRAPVAQGYRLILVSDLAQLGGELRRLVCQGTGRRSMLDWSILIQDVRSSIDAACRSPHRLWESGRRAALP